MIRRERIWLKKRVFGYTRKREYKGKDIRVRICTTLCNTLQHTATLCNTLQHTATKDIRVRREERITKRDYLGTHKREREDKRENNSVQMGALEC